MPSENRKDAFCGFWHSASGLHILWCGIKMRSNECRVAPSARDHNRDMLWLEMSRDEAHGGGSWAFGQSLWSPSRKTNGTKWAFWNTLLRVEAGDPVLHLRGKGDRATFVA